MLPPNDQSKKHVKIAYDKTECQWFTSLLDINQSISAIYRLFNGKFLIVKILESSFYQYLSKKIFAACHCHHIPSICVKILKSHFSFNTTFRSIEVFLFMFYVQYTYFYIYNLFANIFSDKKKKRDQWGRCRWSRRLSLIENSCS